MQMYHHKEDAFVQKVIYAIRIRMESNIGQYANS